MIKNNLLLDFTSSLGSLLVLLTIFTLPIAAKTFNRPYFLSIKGIQAQHSSSTKGWREKSFPSPLGLPILTPQKVINPKKLLCILQEIFHNYV